MSAIYVTSLFSPQPNDAETKPILQSWLWVERNPAMHPVPDLIRYFTGAWRLTRRIRDRRARLPGYLTGQATFVGNAERLTYRETGNMIFGSHQGPASQTYDWDIAAASRAVIRFSDGRHFHELDLSHGLAEVEHGCAPDQYRGRFRVIDTDCWCSVWSIRGPRKDLLIASQFRRLGDGEKPEISWPPA